MSNNNKDDDDDDEADDEYNLREQIRKAGKWRKCTNNSNTIILSTQHAWYNVDNKKYGKNKSKINEKNGINTHAYTRHW